MKHILVTGAAGSIGSGVVARYEKLGARVVGLDVATPAANSSGKFIECDLVDRALAMQVLATYQEEHGAFDGVVNCAGRIHSEPLLCLRDGAMSVHEASGWDETLQANLTSAFNAVCATAPTMVKKRIPGFFVFFGSISGSGNAGQVAYSAAKAALVGMSASLAKELGPLGLRFAVIAPGFIDIASTRDALKDEALSRLKRAVPLRRLGNLDEVFSAVRFVEENTYFNGKVLELDGGLVL